MRERTSFILHIFMLSAIFAGGIWAFISFKDAPAVQFYVVVISITVYIVWGLIYHFIDKSLNRRVIVEYFLVGMLVLLLYSWTLFG